MDPQPFASSDLGLDPINRIFTALVGAYHQLDVGQPARLSSSTLATPPTPSLTWRTGNLQLAEYQPFKWFVTWDIPAVFTVQGEASNVGPFQSALFRLLAWGTYIKGLPTTTLPDGREVVLPAGPAQQEALDAGKLESLLYLGPNITRVAERPGGATGSVTVADITFSLQFVLHADPDDFGNVRVIQASAIPRDIARQNPPIDPSRGEVFEDPIATDADRKAWGGFATPDPPLLQMGRTIVSPAVPTVQGANPANTLGRVDVHGAVASVATSGTVQLQAVGVYLDGSTINLTSAVTWQSSDTNKATVTAGLVTGVASGSATITATLGSLVGSSSVTVT